MNGLLGLALALKLLASFEVPPGTTVDGTPFGGVSGIDYAVSYTHLTLPTKLEV